MKRALFPGSVLALLTLLACSIGWAAPVTNDMVMTVASRWAYAVKTPSGTLRQPVAARPVKNASGVAAFYIVDLAPPGYVIIAADDRAEPVIFFNTDSKAPNLDDPQSPLRSMLFTEVDTRMKAAESFTQVQQVKVASLWGAGTRDPAFYTIVTDEMLTTRWNQHGTRVVAGTPNMNTFNLYTPGGRPAGCGPVAMSQVIRYYRYPAAVRGTGTYHVGGWFPWNVETSSYDAHFNYDQMPDWVNNNSTDDEIRNVASLLAVAGMSSSVIYTASNTAALPGPMLNSFRGTFGYSAGWASGTGLLGSDDATIRTAMQNEITNGFPALLSIRPNFMEIDSAHIVVADGYGTYTHDATVDQVFHINMGWGGSADGWYVVPGFSAGGHAWRTITGIFYGIRPPEIRRVDVQARSAQMAIDEYNGVDTYSNIGQVTPNTLVRASTASAARFEIKIKNNGTWPEIYTLKCSDPDATATARYFVDGIDITSDVKSVAGWRTPRLSAGRTLTVEMQVTVTSALALGVQKNFSFRATSTGNTNNWDTVPIQVERAQRQVSVSMRPVAGIYSHTTQTVSVENASATFFDVKVQNDGEFTDSFYVRMRLSTDMSRHYFLTTPPPLSNWQCVVRDATGADRTALAYWCMLRTNALAPGTSQVYRVYVTPTTQVNGGDSVMVFSEAIASSDSSVHDTLLGRVEKASYNPMLYFTQAQGSVMSSQGDTYSGETRADVVGMPTAAAHFHVVIRNDGTAHDQFRLQGSVLDGGAGWTTSYIQPVAGSGGLNITSDVVAGTYSTIYLAPNSETGIDVYCTPDATVALGAACNLRLVATSINDVNSTTAVRMRAIRGRPGSNIMAAIGTDPYSHNEARLLVDSTEYGSFYLQVRNDGPVTDSFSIRANETNDTGWGFVYYSTPVSTTDVSVQVRNGTWLVGPLPPGTTMAFRVRVALTNPAVAGEANIAMQAFSQLDGSAVDSVNLTAVPPRITPRVGVNTINDVPFQDTQITQYATSTAPSVLYYQVRNDGDAVDSYLLHGTWSSAATPWNIQVFDISGAKEVSAAVAAGTFQTGGINPGSSKVFRVEITPGAAVANGSTGTYTLTATAELKPTVTSAVSAQIIKAGAHPTVLVRNHGETTYISALPSIDVTGDKKVIYEVLVRNDGGSTDTFTLRGLKAETVMAGWVVTYFDAETGNDVTAAMEAGTLSLGPLARGASHAYKVVISPVPIIPNTSQCTVTFRATSNADSSVGEAYMIAHKALTAPNLQVLNGESYGETLPTQPANSSNSARYLVRVRNDGVAADTFSLRAIYGGSNIMDWDVKFYDAYVGGNDVSHAWQSGTCRWEVGPLGVGEAQDILVVITPHTNALADDVFTLNIYADSLGGLDGYDSMALNAVNRVCNPDLKIKVSGAGSYSETSAANSAPPTTTAGYSMVVRNDGQAPATFALTQTNSSTPVSSGWSYTIFDNETGGADITAAVNNGSWIVGPLAAGAQVTYLINVQGSAAVPGNGTFTLTMHALNSDGSGTPDQVAAITRLQLAPTITSIAPTSGVGGTPVTITGTNFTGATGVTFNGTAAVFMVASASSITTTVPVGATSGQVSVTTPSGVANSATSFTVIPQLAVTFSPTSPTATGIKVTITATPATPCNLEYKFRVKYAGVGGVSVWSTIQEYNKLNSCSWTPTDPRVYTVVVYARLIGTTVPYAVYREQPITVNAPMTALALKASLLSPTSVGTTVKLSATATGGGTIEFKFRAKYLTAGGSVWQTMQEYSQFSTCNWMPAEAHAYTLYVYAREKGSKAAYDLYRELPFTVNPVVSNVLLTASCPSPTGLGTPVKLIATATGGGTLEYKFFALYKDSKDVEQTEVISSDFSLSNNITWSPKKETTYGIVVQVRERGNPELAFVTALKDYVVVAAVSDLQLVSSLHSPSHIGVPMTLTATATGGGTLDYQFRVKYTGSSGSVWQTLQAYGTSNTCPWTPTEAHAYTIIVYAREHGTTMAYKIYRELPFTVVP